MTEIIVQKKTLHKIKSLLRFYDLTNYSNEKNENDATQMILRSDNVNEHMKILLAE